jgi:hypothetical protein
MRWCYRLFFFFFMLIVNESKVVMKMGMMKQWKFNGFGWLMFLILLSGCSAPLLSVSYTLPTHGEGLPKDTVFLEVVDQRATPAILTAAAGSREAFLESQNEFLLNIQDNTGTVVTSRLVDKTAAAFVEAFKSRMERQGWRIAGDGDRSRPGLKILIEHFVLDADGRTFIAQVTYRAEFYRDGKLIRQDRITGSADNYYLRKSETASTTLSQAFTSAVNALDLSPLGR